jgi:hypothetical protein
MTSHFDAVIALLGVILGMLATLVSVVWKARGWIDRLNTTDGRLADAIDGLKVSQRDQHRENQERFRQIEIRLARGQSGHPRAGTA